MSEKGPREKGDSGTGTPEEDATVVRSLSSPPAQTLLYADALGDTATQVRSLATPLFPTGPSTPGSLQSNTQTHPADFKCRHLHLNMYDKNTHQV